MTSGQTVGRKTRNPYAGSAVGIANRLHAPLLHSGGRRDVIDTSNAARISGSADIPLDLLPTILLIESPEDPRSTHVFDLERPGVAQRRKLFEVPQTNCDSTSF
jgi:hypothetical protein